MSNTEEVIENRLSKQKSADWGILECAIENQNNALLFLARLLDYLREKEILSDDEVMGIIRREDMVYE